MHYPPERVLVVRSEDFFTDPAAAFRRVVEFADLAPWQPEAFVNASRMRERRTGRTAAGGRRPPGAGVRCVNDDLAELLGDGAPRW